MISEPNCAFHRVALTSSVKDQPLGTLQVDECEESVAVKFAERDHVGGVTGTPPRSCIVHFKNLAFVLARPGLEVVDSETDLCKHLAPWRKSLPPELAGASSPSDFAGSMGRALGRVGDAGSRVRRLSWLPRVAWSKLKSQNRDSENNTDVFGRAVAWAMPNAGLCLSPGS